MKKIYQKEIKNCQKERLEANQQQENARRLIRQLQEENWLLRSRYSVRENMIDIKLPDDNKFFFFFIRVALFAVDLQTIMDLLTANQHCRLVHLRHRRKTHIVVQLTLIIITEQNDNYQAE